LTQSLMAGAGMRGGLGWRWGIEDLSDRGWTHTQINTHIYARTITHAHTHTHKYTCTHTHAQTHTYLYTRERTHKHSHTHVRTITHARTHTHAHTHTHTHRDGCRIYRFVTCQTSPNCVRVGGGGGDRWWYRRTDFEKGIEETIRVVTLISISPFSLRPTPPQKPSFSYPPPQPTTLISPLRCLPHLCY
jgi:hypothetical protein